MIDELIEQAKEIGRKNYKSSGYIIINHPEWQAWGHRSLLYLKSQFENSTQITLFEKTISNEFLFDYNLKTLVGILTAYKEFGSLKSNNQKNNSMETLEMIFNKFGLVARQLEKRYSNRNTIKINDEYDVQDLLHSLLKIHFNDIRPEEWIPSYAGSSKRADFLLKNEHIVIEVKKTRQNLKDKDIGEQLTIDIANYQNHPNCKKIVCFVYDPDNFIINPYAIENDLSKTINNLEVKVFIYPK